MRPKCPTQIPIGKDLHHDVGQSLGGTHEVLYMTSANHPVKFPRAKLQSKRVEPRQKASRKSLGSPYKQEGTADL